ncbi:hypothetical protein [Halomonas denitrificans]|uniref:hypothetical protein n=1 Tax=Halomonas denitrificans TaxID=370769 RepID=UPI0013005D44|nr:hypothetical protein [Halomonas denitrificans]
MHPLPSLADQPLSLTYDHESREMVRYRGRALPEQYRLHLSISDDAMATQTLSYALAFAQHSRQFSELMARHCQLAGLSVSSSISSTLEGRWPGQL